MLQPQYLDRQVAVVFLLGVIGVVLWKSGYGWQSWLCFALSSGIATLCVAAALLAAWDGSQSGADDS